MAVYSCGTKPEEQVNPIAVKVMHEVGIDISSHTPVNVNEYIDKSFDYLITVCDSAKEKCPVFKGKVSKRIHIGFEDPANFKGTEDEVIKHYQRSRDQIMERFKQFYNQKVLEANI